jgi:hypothetical protein
MLSDAAAVKEELVSPTIEPLGIGARIRRLDACHAIKEPMIIIIIH